MGISLRSLPPELAARLSAMQTSFAAKPAKQGRIRKSEKSSRTVGEIVFDSKIEAAAYEILRDSIGEDNFTRQVPFELQPKFKCEGENVRAINYVADFVFGKYDGVTLNESNWVIDIKGFETEMFKIKHKIFQFKYGRKLILLKSKKEIIDAAAKWAAQYT